MATTRPRKTRTASPAKFDPYAHITEKIISMLEAGTAPWHQPWKVTAGAGVAMPRSLSSRKPYRGINVWLLAAAAMERGFRSPWWGTYKQIAERGGQVRKGEKSEQVVLWRPFTVTDKETGKEEKRFMLRVFRVFNAEQADGLDRFVPAELPVDDADQDAAEVEQIEACEDALRRYYATGGPTLAHYGDAAYYRPSEDRVQLPPREAFTSAPEFYGTWFHETVHSTGHESRLNREGVANLPADHRFGSPLYSKEELVAEMGAAFLAGVTGVAAATLPNSAAYLANWIKVLRGDSRLVVQAAAQAQKAVDLILGDLAPVEVVEVEEAPAELVAV